MIWHSSSVEEVLSELKTDTKNGLWATDISEKLITFGKNTTTSPAFGGNNSFDPTHM